ncbi:MAG: PKD-like family lipoprotein [Odoribacter sp.]
MKKLFYILIVFQLLCVGCFEDESNLNIRKINPIEIEMFGGNQLLVKQMDTLKVEPLIYCEGVPDSELSFEWMFMNYGTMVPRLLDTTMYCCAQITEKPGKNYTLRLTVTDRTTGIFRIQTYMVNVGSNFDAGLLIADTKDGGVTSDLNLVKCREFNADYALENETRDVYRNMWESVNGASFGGEILAAQTANAWSQNTSVTVVTTQDLYRANYKDYVWEWTGDQMFYVKPPFSGQELQSATFAFRTNNVWEAMMVNGLFFQRNLQNNGRQYGYPVYPSGVKEYAVSMMCLPLGTGLYPVYCYDAIGKRMLFFYNESGYKPVDQLGGPFDVNDLSGYDPLFLGQSAEGMTFMVKNRNSGAYQALVMNVVLGADVAGATKFAKNVYDLSAASNIGDARFYALNRQGNAVYYATETAVYAGPLDHMSDAKLRWSAGIGETITGIRLYDWTGGKHYYMGAEEKEDSQESADRMLLITTQNAKGEGKVTAVPVLHQNIGQLEQNKKYQVVLEGFGKILGIYKQL